MLGTKLPPGRFFGCGTTQPCTPVRLPRTHLFRNGKKRWHLLFWIGQQPSLSQNFEKKSATKRDRLTKKIGLIHQEILFDNAHPFQTQTQNRNPETRFPGTKARQPETNIIRKPSAGKRRQENLEVQFSKGERQSSR